MDLFNFRFIFLFLSAVGCCNGQDAPLISGQISGVFGKNVTFSTTVKDNEIGNFLTISWVYQKTNSPVVTSAPGGVIVGPGYDGRVFLNTSNGVLNIGPLTSKDSGTYTLNMVTNTAVTRTGSIMLTVLDPVSGVTITSNMNAAVEFNSTVVLTCSALGSALTYQWINGTAPVVADGTHVTISNSTVLTVANVYRNDLVGPIYCTASNLEQAISAPFNLTVSYGPELISMTVNPGPGAQVKGSNVTFSCSAQSSPPATLMWILNGVLLPTTGPVLMLANIAEAQSGNYSCMAYNPKTLRYLASTTASITVIAAISGTNVTGLTTPLIAGNSTGNLTCRAAVGIADTTLWLKDDVPLNPSSRVVFSPDKSSVIINPLQKGDSGTYKCMLSNAISSDSVIFRMNISFGPEEVVVEGKHAIHEQDSITLKCHSLSHPPAAYAWKFNGTQIAVVAAENTITAATFQNTGIYTCVASNAVTGKTISVDHMLSVKKLGEPTDEPEGLTGGQVAGIIIGVVIALVLIVAVVMYMRQKKPIESPY
ncbi:carcinoembryonic antigen-related cell adhesion molecule 5 [Esox lucius]|uniref:Ig-like domain-containing protein n=2 Tax=Esox lucius TaxID=8010 RepID=A0A3P8YZW1_ESOLU|nr:carcinoembryonic antigen-related cell adhesion molecule 5 [Esox lucius]